MHDRVQNSVIVIFLQNEYRPSLFPEHVVDLRLTAASTISSVFDSSFFDNLVDALRRSLSPSHDLHILGVETGGDEEEENEEEEEENEKRIRSIFLMAKRKNNEIEIESKSELSSRIEAVISTLNAEDIIDGVDFDPCSRDPCGKPEETGNECSVKIAVV